MMREFSHCRVALSHLFVLAALGSVALGCASGGAPAPQTASLSSEPEPAELSATEESAASAMETEAPEAPIPVAEEPTEIVAEPEPVTVEDPEDLLADSLEAFESSKAFWEQGSFDDAFAALDRAYGLMVQVPTNGDPLIDQQKEDLRQLISRRVVEIYASRQTVVGDLSLEIPITINKYVQREIESFQGPEREFFLASYQRSGHYRPMILKELRAAGLPDEISWLPLVESGFKVKALSRARALGLWQFISSTGYRYGLERSWWMDERMDPDKATVAAIAYLTDLHGLFGDWTTALAGYNSGEGRVLRAIKSQNESYFDHFWDIYERLPRETRRYVPRFLAVLAIVQEPAQYGFELPEPFAAPVFEVVAMERSTSLEVLDRALDIEVGTLRILNPELRRGATPADPYDLKVPPGQAESLKTQLASVPQWAPPRDAYAIHRVRRGESLSVIAQRYGTSVNQIVRENGMRSPDRIWPGQQLRVPDRGPAPAAAATGPGGEVRHRVRAGDSLWVVAQRYGTTVDRIRRQNNLRSDLLQPGQELVVRPGTVASASGGGKRQAYVVRRGDTLGKIAQRQRVSLNRLLSANGLTSRSVIYPGQRLLIP